MHNYPPPLEIGFYFADRINIDNHLPIGPKKEFGVELIGQGIQSQIKHV